MMAVKKKNKWKKTTKILSPTLCELRFAFIPFSVC